MAKKKHQAGPLDRDAFAPLPDEASSAIDDACSDGLENCGSSIGGSEINLLNFCNHWKENLTVGASRGLGFAGASKQGNVARRMSIGCPLAQHMHSLVLYPVTLKAPPTFPPPTCLMHQVNLDLDQVLVEAAQARLLVAIDAEHTAELCKQAKKLDSTRERLQESGVMLMGLRLEPLFRT